MPLSEKARIEVYLPDLPRPSYRDLLEALEQEFTHTFGGCTTVHGLSGHYLSDFGLTIPDRVNLLYTDAALAFDEKQGAWGPYLATRTGCVTRRCRHWMRKPFLSSSTQCITRSKPPTAQAGGFFMAGRTARGLGW